MLGTIKVLSSSTNSIKKTFQKAKKPMTKIFRFALIYSSSKNYPKKLITPLHKISRLDFSPRIGMKTRNHKEYIRIF